MATRLDIFPPLAEAKKKAGKALWASSVFIRRSTVAMALNLLAKAAWATGAIGLGLQELLIDRRKD
jgi:hypothetical protein